MNASSPSTRLRPLLLGLALCIGLPDFRRGYGAVADDANWEVMSGQLPGVDGRVSAFATSGNRLYAGGRFRIIGGVVTSGVASWDGTRWSALGTGITGGVSALLARGSDLIAAGDFSSAGGVPAIQVARWDGAKWNALGTLASQPSGEVLALAEFGGEIHAGGTFQTSTGAAASYLARWTGARWLPVDGGLDGIVYALHVFDGALFAGGAFRTAGGQAVNGIARWNGTEWKPVEQGVRGSINTVYALGSVTTNLYVGGDFTEAGGSPWTPALGLARVFYVGDKPRWRSLHVPLVSVRTLRGSGDRLFVGGRFTGIGTATSRNIAELASGTNWISYGTGVSAGNPSDVGAIEPFGGQVFCGGFFETAGDQRIPGIARWTGSAWQSVGGGTDYGLNQGSQRVRVVGGRVYVLGTFRNAGPTAAPGAAEWTGAGWVAMGGGVPQWTQFQQARAATDGRDLFVTMAGGGVTRFMHRWDGTSWSPVGDAGPQGAVAAAGSELHAFGNFSHGFGVAKRNGNRWEPVGGTFTVGNPVAFGGNGHLVAAGTNLYAGGAFTSIGGEPIASVAQWDGVKWKPLGPGWPGTAAGNGVGALGATSDGRLYLGPASNARANTISVWDGSAWSTLPGTFAADGSGVFIYSLVVDGTDLWVGGRFDRIDDLPASNIARWDGRRWHALGSGVSGANAFVLDLAVTPDRVYAAGPFTTAGGQGSRYFAIWHKPKVEPLSIAFTLPVDRVGIGQEFDLQIDLRNSSTELLSDVVVVPPALRSTGGAEARLRVSTIPPTSLPGRSGRIYTYTYEATKPGRMAFHAAAQGRRPDGSLFTAPEADSPPVLICPGDLSAKRDDETLAEYAGRDLYQATARAPQVKVDYVPDDRTARFQVRIHNRDSREHEFVLQAAVRGKTGWPRTYLLEGRTDLAPEIETPSGSRLIFEGRSAGTVEVTIEPRDGFPGDSQRIEFTLRPADDPQTVLDAVEVGVDTVNEIVVNSTGDEADADLTDDLPDVDTKKPGLQTTLRCALDFANRLVGHDLIRFDIPPEDPGWLGGLPWIRPLRALPRINGAISLDGTTHPVSGLVAIDGAGAGLADGLGIDGNDTIVRGMVIKGFQGAGLAVEGAMSAELTHNLIGIEPSAGSGSGTGGGNGTGIRLRKSHHIRIGGGTFASRNVISGNKAHGIDIADASHVHAQVNFVGTTANGLGGLPNGLTGLLAQRATGLVVGLRDHFSLFNGPTAIQWTGVSGAGSGGGGAAGELVNCRIGLSASGTAALGQTAQGLVLEDCSGVTIGGGGGAATSADLEALRNVFAGISGSAMRFLRSTNIHVGANHVGTDVSGNADAAVGVGLLADQVRDLFVGSGSGTSVFHARQVGAVLRRVTSSASGKAASSLVNLRVGVRADGGGFGSGARGLELHECEDLQIGKPEDLHSGSVFGGLSDGIEIRDSQRIQVTRSRIGVAGDKPVDKPIPNTGAGIVISGTCRAIGIGGEEPQAANVIAHCQKEGIRVSTTSTNVILRGNAIFRTHKPVDRPSSGEHFPAITKAFRGSTHAEGTLNGRPGDSVRLEFFAHRPDRPTEAEIVLGAIQVTLDAAGTANYKAVLPLSAPAGWHVTSTASDSFAGTSELSASVPIGPAPDSDGDGLPDFWEARFPSCLNPVVPDPPEEDCDGDGFTNLQEYLAHTDPSKIDSFLHIENLSLGAGTELTFQAAAGRQYGLERSANGAVGPWTRVATAAPDADGRITLSDPHPGPDRGFYRIVAEFP